MGRARADLPWLDALQGHGRMSRMAEAFVRRYAVRAVSLRTGLPGTTLTNAAITGGKRPSNGTGLATRGRSSTLAGAAPQHRHIAWPGSQYAMAPTATVWRLRIVRMNGQRRGKADCPPPESGVAAHRQRGPQSLGGRRVIQLSRQDYVRAHRDPQGAHRARRWLAPVIVCDSRPSTDRCWIPNAP